MRGALGRLLVSFGVCVAAWGCASERARELSIDVELPSGLTDVYRVRGEIVRGGCEGSVIPYAEDRVAGGGPLTMAPPLLAEGRYGLRVRVGDASCQWVAETCQEVTLPRDDGSRIVLAPTILEVPEYACPAAQSCIDSECAVCVTADDPRCCGQPNFRCPGAPQADPTCAEGRCGLACRMPFIDCDGDMSGTGCEIDSSQPATCGDCSVECAAGDVCARPMPGEPFACGDNCPAGTADCDGTCADLMSNPLHCGACDAPCDFGVESLSSVDCESGQCVYECTGTLSYCETEFPDAGVTQRICVDLQISQAHCGRCGNSCGSARCCQGECRPRSSGCP